MSLEIHILFPLKLIKTKRKEWIASDKLVSTQLFFTSVLLNRIAVQTVTRVAPLFVEGQKSHFKYFFSVNLLTKIKAIHGELVTIRYSE